MATKKRPSLLRIIITGLIWTPLYLQATALFFWNVFGFNTLLPEQWQTLFKQFINEQWIVNTGWDLALFFSILLLIPLWIIGWIFLNRVRWLSFVPKRLKEHRTQKAILTQPTPKKAFAPTKMRVQTSAVLAVNMAQAQQMVADQANTASIPAPSRAPATPTYPDEADIQQILPLVQGIPADFFPHISLNNHYAAFALSTETKAIVTTLLNRPGQNWSVDTETEIGQSDWYSETEIWPTPLADIIQVTADLQESDPDSIATPVAVLMSGNIINIEDVMAFYEKKGVILTRLDTVNEPDIPLFSDFLNLYFNSGNTEKTESKTNEESVLQKPQPTHFVDDEDSVPEPEEA